MSQFSVNKTVKIGDVKMAKYKLSIIVPVYNVERYVLSALESIWNYEYLGTEVELIIVDDGSTDSSSKIVSEFQEAYETNVKLYSVENSGLASARNYGLSKAQGEWIYFFDSDDFVDSNFLEYIISALSSVGTEVNMILIPVKQVNEGKVKGLGKNPQRNTVIDPETFFQSLLTRDREIAAWSYIARKQLYVDYDIKFPDGKLFEDQLVTVQIGYNAKKILWLSDKSPAYYYRQRPGSITKQRFSLQKALQQRLAETDRNEYIVQKFPNLSNLICMDQLSIMLSWVRRLVRSGKIEEAELHRRKYLRDGWTEATRAAIVGRKYKVLIKAVILLVPAKIFKVIG